MTLQDSTTILDVALDALRLGFSVVPPAEDGTKRPAMRWQTYQQRLPTEDELRAWYSTPRHGIGVVCGAVSGNLEMLEFEGRAVTTDIDKEFRALAEKAGLSELVERIFAGYCEWTPTGGMHLLYRVDQPVAGNTKLASRPATAEELAENPADRVKVLIETRGEGGYVIVAPSHGPVHQSAGEWWLSDGGFATLVTITGDERDELHRLARALDLMPTPAPVNVPRTEQHRDDDGQRPGDIYNRHPEAVGDTLKLLERHGWTRVFERPHNGHYDIHLRRPGKQHGTSAVYHLNAGTLYVFTSSTSFTPEQAYSPFAILAELEHGGDYKAAARALRPAGTSSNLNDLIVTSPANVDPATGEITTPAEQTIGPTPIDWTSFWNREHIGEDWLVEPVVPRGRQVALWARHKTGKSLLSLEIAAAAATGRACLSQPAGAPVNVVYVDLEMTEDDLHDRLDEMGYGPDSDLSHLHYYLLPSLPPLDSAAGGAAVVNVAVRHQAQLVVIDTMARAVAGDENDADTYRDFYRYTGLHLKARGISMLRLDHGGKDATKGQRGSSGKGDDVDVVWQLSIADDGLTLKRDAARMSWVPERVALRRVDDPLRHLLVEDLWPAGTAEVASVLERIGVAVDATQRDASSAFRDSGHQAKTDVIRAALKYRRQTSLRALIGGAG